MADAADVPVDVSAASSAKTVLTAADAAAQPAGAVQVEYKAGLWERKTWRWARYDEGSEKAILGALRAGQPTLNITFGAAHSYTINLGELSQTNLLSNKKRPIRFVAAI